MKDLELIFKIRGLLEKVENEDIDGSLYEAVQFIHGQLIHFKGIIIIKGFDDEPLIDRIEKQIDRLDRWIQKESN